VTIFDYVVLFVLVCSVLISTLRGLMREVLSLAGWVVAFVVANAYSGALAPLIRNVVPGATTRLIVAFIALFIGVRILVGLLAMTLDAVVKATGLTPADRALGALFGLARGLVMILAAVLVCGMTAVPQQPFWKDAVFSPVAESAATTALPFLPEEFARRIRF
jgi:membrane protein required for colicin V production